MADVFSPPTAGDIRSPVRFLLWLVREQPGRVAAGATLGSVWMIGLAVPPYLLSRAIDDGLGPRDHTALFGWVAVLFVAGALNAAVGIARHRTMTKVRMDASFRVVRATVRRATELGAALPHRMSAGEVVAIGMGDVTVIAQSLTVTGPGIGAVVAYLAVAAVLLSISPLLAAVVLAGVPMIAVTVGPLQRRLQQVGTGYREEQGELTALLVDVATGLPVLNGLGGKDVYAARYCRRSHALRAQGYRVGAVTSWVGALATGLPALFLALVTWLAARMTADGTLAIGDLVAVYGYAAMLVVPVFFFIEGANDVTRALVAARRVTGFLALTPDQYDGPDPVDAPPAPAALYDPLSGVVVRPGLLTAIAAGRPADSAAVVERLGRFADSDAEWGGARLGTVALTRVRECLLVADNDAALFSGTVREAVAGRGAADDTTVRAAIRAAAATDIVDALPAGLDSALAAGGRNLSGGQRQRLRLARAVCADPEVLLAVEPTSAVDTHTEAAMATGLRTARAGRTTVVTTTSPLVLDRADEVIHLADGRVAATGTHHTLLRTDPAYRAMVSRAAQEEAPA
jgi:ABC-type multidrug transport system fused ATPase/permease subunit